MPRSTQSERIIIALLMMFLLCSAFSIALAQIGYFSALTIWVIRMVLRKQKEFARTDVDIFFLLYAVAEFISFLVSYNQSQSLLYLQRRLLLLPIVHVLVSNIDSERTLRWMFGAMILSALGVALWSCRDLVLHFPAYLRFERRLSEFQIYMTAGGIMMIAVLMVLPFVVHRSTPTRIRWGAAVLLFPLMVNLLFTFTRSSWLGFLAGAIVIAARRNWRILIPLVVVVVLVIGLSAPDMQERMISTFDLHHPNNSSRVQMWHVGLQMFLDHPIFGIGDMGTEQLWDRYGEPGWVPEGHLHSNVLMWMATLGSVGTIVLIGLFVRIWITLSAIEKWLRAEWFLGSLSLGGLAGLVGFHVNGLFEWNFGDAEIIMLIWAIAGLGFAADRVKSRELVQ